MTDKVTIDRETLQAALGAVDPHFRWHTAIVNLRAALAAQPAEPVAWLWRLNHSGKAFFMVADSTLREVLTDAFPVYAAPPAPAAVPPGWKLVPIEPTPGMIASGAVALMKASHSDLDCTTDEIAAAYHAMIAAAGEPSHD